MLSASTMPLINTWTSWSVFYDANGISSDPRNLDLVLEEKSNILQREFPTFLEDYERLNYLENVNPNLLSRIKRGIKYNLRLRN